MVYFFVGILFGIVIGAGIAVVTNYETQRKRFTQCRGVCINIIRQENGEIEAGLLVPRTLDEELRQDHRVYVHLVGNAPVYFSDLSSNRRTSPEGMHWGINNPPDD